MDVQNQDDKRNVKLDWVGVKGVLIPIKLKDKKYKVQHVTADTNVYVSLDKIQKGIHMSHLVDKLFNLTEDYALPKLVKLSKEIKDEQSKENKTVKTEDCLMHLKFKYFVDKVAPISKVKSKLGYDVEMEVSVGKNNYKSITVYVPVSTCCPCSLALTDGKGAHNQRGIITIKLYQNIDDKKLIWFEDLIEIAERSGSCEIYPVLRRPDEKYVTEKMFANAKFVEDCVRDTIINLREKIGKYKYIVSCENFESIHQHNAWSESTVEYN
jgi:GTP cyclohydrolase I